MPVRIFSDNEDLLLELDGSMSRALLSILLTAKFGLDRTEFTLSNPLLNDLIAALRESSESLEPIRSLDPSTQEPVWAEDLGSVFLDDLTDKATRDLAHHGVELGNLDKVTDYLKDALYPYKMRGNEIPTLLYRKLRKTSD